MRLLEGKSNKWAIQFLRSELIEQALTFLDKYLQEIECAKCTFMHTAGLNLPAVTVMTERRHGTAVLNMTRC